MCLDRWDLSYMFSLYSDAQGVFLLPVLEINLEPDLSILEAASLNENSISIDLRMERTVDTLDSGMSLRPPIAVTTRFLSLVVLRMNPTTIVASASANELTLTTSSSMFVIGSLKSENNRFFVSGRHEVESCFILCGIVLNATRKGNMIRQQETTKRASGSWLATTAPHMAGKETNQCTRVVVMDCSHERDCVGMKLVTQQSRTTDNNGQL